MKSRILVVEDEPSLRNLLIDSITAEGLEPVGVKNAEDAIKHLEDEPFDIVLTDVNLPGKSGLELLPICLQRNPDAYVLVMTGYGTIDNAVKAMKLGASDFLCKPISLDDLISVVRVASEKTADRGSETVKTKKTDSSIIVQSEKMLKILEQIETIAPYRINVLVMGETGTGKELVAREIHNASPRAKEAFVAMNCAAIPENLLEDELFGHVKGAYTGAQNGREGRFEQADKGTLFLDEIGDMNLALQAKLLRVLQEMEFERLGSTQTIKVDVRIVAATSADLDAKIEDGSFRADLYHRLNVVNLKIPALRERPDDILAIAQGLLNRFCESAGLPEKRIDEETYKALISYDFPGNVRQLQNSVERGAVFSGVDSELRLEHMPEEIRNQSDASFIAAKSNSVPNTIPDEGIDLSNVVSQVERDLLIQTLDKTGGNKMQAAKLLNLKRTTLVEKVKRLRIEEENDSGDEAALSKTG